MSDRWSYWNGPDEIDRREKYAKSWKPEYQAAGDDLQRRIEAVEIAFVSETGISLPYGYASGWRPPSINEATSNAAKASTHLTAQGGDKRDEVNGALCWWCMRNPHILERHQLYLEHPAATVIRAWKKAQEQKRDPTPWCHFQSVSPKSHLRVYWPDSSSMAEWKQFLEDGFNENTKYETWADSQK